jgi:DNA repair photolyase
LRIISNLYDFTDRSKWDGPYRVVGCKKALSPSKLPGIDYALNPYGGCAHGCVYCYAPEVTHSDWDDWRVVKVKSNIVERLEKEIGYISGTVGVGTTTDPYQYAESRFMLTQQCLCILKAKGVGVHIHTKSDLILRDADLIASMRSVVGVTVTGIDDRISKMTEPGAPLPKKRLEAIRGLVDAGVEVYALVEPVLGHLEGHEREFVDAVADTGVRTMYIDGLNGRPLLSERMARMHMCGSFAALETIRAIASDCGMNVFDVF